MKSFKKRILTGDRPTGPLHLGHYAGSLANRIKLQEKYECFFIIADYQTLPDHLLETKEIGRNIQEIILDYLSAGINPKKSAIFIQSKIPEIAELTMYFSMLVNLSRVQRNPTVKDEIRAAKIGKKEVSYGFVGYPISQAADILVVRAGLVPAGEDQLPHLEQTREIARSFNRIFKKVFPIPEPLLSRFSRLPGLDGKKKMSKSENNAIYLKDSPEEVKKKVMKAYTDPSRIHADDPGHIEGNVVFAYLEAFHSNKKELEKLKTKYKKGKISDVEVKKILIETLNGFLNPIRKKRKKFESEKGLIKKTLAFGIEKTRREAEKTLKLVRAAMNFDYKKLF